MIRSMTGFGESELAVPTGRLRVELRTVNHRYLNVNARLPNALARWEPEIREWLRGHFTRGHVNCTVRFEREESGPGALGLKLDVDRAATYVALLRELGERFSLAGEPDLAQVARFGDIFVREEADPDEEPVGGDDLRIAIEKAAAAAVIMRRDEGRRLQVDLDERFAAIEESLDEIERMAPARLEAERDRLLHQLLGVARAFEKAVVALVPERDVASLTHGHVSRPMPGETRPFGGGRKRARAARRVASARSNNRAEPRAPTSRRSCDRGRSA